MQESTTAKLFSSPIVVGGFLLTIAVIVAAVLVSNTTFVIRNLGGGGDGTAPINSIAVAAEGEAFLSPDTATFSIGISETAPTTKQAIQQANRKINEVRDIVKNRADDKDIQTSSFSLYPEYDYTNSGRKLKGQRASQTLTVKIREIESDASDVADLIDKISAINNIQFNGISFTAEDDEAGISAARADAMEKAKAKAEELAELGQVRILTPVSISESSRGISSPIYYNRADQAFNDGAESAPGTELSTGELQVTVSVSVLYAIE